MKTVQYAVYSQSPYFVPCLDWVTDNNIAYEVHLNRTRFWVPHGPLLTEFLLRWAAECELIDSQ